MRTLLCLLAIILGGCTSIEKRVEGWPQDMVIRVHKNTPFMDIQRICWQGMPTWRKLLLSVCPTAAYVNLNTNTCDIYVLDDSEPTEHELEHCKGGDHDGALQRYYDAWKQTSPS